jgi:acetyl-CoA acyltransferase
MKTAYIVQGYRTAVAKSKRGAFRFKRADELAAETIEYLMENLPEFDKKRIDDVIVGNAMPEGFNGIKN